MQYGFVFGRRNVARCSGAEPSNANISFPEHFEGKRQSGEMYQNDCLPLLSTFCKFQRLKVKGSQVMLICLHQHTVGAASQRRRRPNVNDLLTICWLSSDSETPLWQPHTFVCDCAQLHPWLLWHGLEAVLILSRDRLFSETRSHGHVYLWMDISHCAVGYPTLV